MALTALFTYEAQNKGTKLLVTDTTVYGDGLADPSREQSLVDFSIVHYPSSGSVPVVVNYIPETVASILASLTEDGWYAIQMTITKNPDGDWAGADYSYRKAVNIFIQERLKSAINNIGDKIFSDCECGCESPARLLKYYCLKGQECVGMVGMVGKNDLASAQMTLERLRLEAANLENDCGCH